MFTIFKNISTFTKILKLNTMKKALFTLATVFYLHTNAQIISTVAGDNNLGFSGDGNAAITAELNSPTGVAHDNSGNLYIVDQGNSRIRMVNGSGIITTIAGNGTVGYSGDAGQATAAELNGPTGVAINPAGTIYIADAANNRIRVINNFVINTAIGNGTAGFSGDGGLCNAAELKHPTGVAFDASGNVYIADYGNNRVRKVTISSGIISTVAGYTATGGYSGDGGQATAAELDGPIAVVIDALDNIYISDYNNARIRKINTLGIISTYAGTGTGGYSGDGAAATAAKIFLPSGVTVDAVGNLYIADFDNNRIRKVSTTGIITTIAGTGVASYSGNGGQANAADLSGPRGVALDNSGNLYIADGFNNVVRMVTNVAAAGIQQFAGINNQVMVYPNPASNSFQVLFSGTNGQANVNLYDITGKLVLSQAINGTATINTSSLSEGVYNLNIISDEGTANKKVIIIK
jgi:sugar lactone lactonase YvrE